MAKNTPGLQIAHMNVAFDSNNSVLCINIVGFLLDLSIPTILPCTVAFMENQKFSIFQNQQRFRKIRSYLSYT